MELPSVDAIKWLVSRYAGLHDRQGAAIGRPDLIQPNDEFFPDVVEKTGEGVITLLARVLDYAPVKDGLRLGLRVTDDVGMAEGCGPSGCGSGGCKTGTGLGLCDRVVPMDEGYLVELPASAAASPVFLMATLARAAGSIVLFEADEDVDPKERGPMSEVAAVASGLGPLLFAGSYVYGKSCGGASVTKQTHLTVEEVAVALALFAQVHGVPAQEVTAHAEVTQREAFGEAWAWARSNARLMADLRTRPAAVEAGMFRLEETKGALGQWLAARSVRAEERELESVATQVVRRVAR